jgi:beta-galactosidase
LVTIGTLVLNEGLKSAQFQLHHSIVDATGEEVVTSDLSEKELVPGEKYNFTAIIEVVRPQLWSLESPHLYRVLITIRDGDKVVDSYKTPFGIRTIRFDPNQGFFLNGKHVRLLGTNNHQDHAGVGVALPDALQEYRIKRLKEVGCNAIRTAHNPPTPELLDACDRLGMLVMNESRLLGSDSENLRKWETHIRREKFR